MSRERFFRLAQAWDAQGRPDAMLLDNEWQLLAMRCWFQSDGAEHEGRDAVVADFGDACEKAYERTSPDWWGRLLATRGHCERCGERYRIENMAVCSHCLRTYCHRCMDEPSGPNGNRVHHCGGELVG